jgi:hypothetical protein
MPETPKFSPEGAKFALFEVLGVVGTEAAAAWMQRISTAGIDNIIITPAQTLQTGLFGLGVGAGLYFIVRIVNRNSK